MKTRRLVDKCDYAARLAGVARECAVPGCIRPPDGRLPVCKNHRTCPRCGMTIHTHRREHLDCCGLHFANLRRWAWIIPWQRLLRAARPFHQRLYKLRRARILVGKKVIAAGLPIPIEAE